MDSLLWYALGVILILLIVIAVIVSTQKVIETIDDYYYDVVDSEIISLMANTKLGNFSEVNQRDLVTAVRVLKSVPNNISTYADSLSDMSNLSKNWEDNELESPQFLAYILSLSNFARNDSVEQSFAGYIEWYPNPFVRHNENTAIDIAWSELYRKLSYFVIYYAFLAKYKLSTELYYDSAVELKVNNYLKADIVYDALPKLTASLTDGYFVDEAFEENGLRSNINVPYGIADLSTMAVALFYLMQYKPNKKLKALAGNMFNRLAIAFFGEYTQLRGGGKYITSMRYKADWLLALSYLNQIDKKLSIGNEFIRQVGTLNPTTKNRLAGLPKYSLTAAKSLNKFQYCSLSEGFVLLRNGSNILELASGADFYSITGDTANNSDLLANNSTFTKGYLNYGCDYTSLFVNYNSAPSTAFKLSGQAYNTDPVFPESVTAVPIDSEKTLFYTSHSYPGASIEGYYDSVAGIHTYTVNNSLSNTYYYPFTWVSESPISYQFSTNSISIAVPGNTFTIDSSVAISIHTTVLASKSIYVEISTSKVLPTNAAITFTIARKNNTTTVARVPTLSRYRALDSNLTAIVPHNGDVSGLVFASYENNAIIAYAGSPGLRANTITGLTYKGTSYTMTSKSMRLYTKL
ncbi:hypothetical protein [Tomelloso virus]|uniref:Uncharacterized protein n=1 Tax=Tomelloso virus TaxID=2053981 RepID=A0A2H4T2N5_9VIRU|nr:hypothetical protein [Tomelloso virus]ATY70185.1 hypothetical protein [Tomelloso virus]